MRVHSSLEKFFLTVVHRVTVLVQHRQPKHELSEWSRPGAPPRDTFLRCTRLRLRSTRTRTGAATAGRGGGDLSCRAPIPRQCCSLHLDEAPRQPKGQLPTRRARPPVNAVAARDDGRRHPRGSVEPGAPTTAILMVGCGRTAELVTHGEECDGHNGKVPCIARCMARAWSVSRRGWLARHLRRRSRRGQRRLPLAFHLRGWCLLHRRLVGRRAQARGCPGRCAPRGRALRACVAAGRRASDGDVGRARRVLLPSCGSAACPHSSAALLATSVYFEPNRGP